MTPSLSTSLQRALFLRDGWIRLSAQIDASVHHDLMYRIEHRVGTAQWRVACLMVKHHGSHQGLV